MRKEIREIEATDEAIPPCPGCGEAYRERVAMIRERLCPDHQKVWDELSYARQCGFIAKMVKDGLLSDYEAEAEAEHDRFPKDRPDRDEALENHWDQREHYREMG